MSKISCDSEKVLAKYGVIQKKFEQNMRRFKKV